MKEGEDGAHEAGSGDWSAEIRVAAVVRAHAVRGRWRHTCTSSEQGILLNITPLLALRKQTLGNTTAAS
eukprot:SAG22_NODE_1636_length_3923_cov_3.294195_2_plen_69_part_00